MKQALIFAFATLICTSAFAGDGKIIFSKSPITGEAGENAFTVGDKIYCKAIIETPLSEYKLYDNYGKKTDAKVAGYLVLVYIDDFKYCNKISNINGMDGGIKYYLCNDTANASLLDKTTLVFTFNESPHGSQQIKKDLNSLKEGKHTVRLEVWASNGYANYAGSFSKKPIAIGEFELNKTANSSVKMGFSFNDVKAKMSDPKLEAKILAKLTESGAKNILKLKIVTDWKIKNHPSSGAILARGIVVAVLSKEERGCMIHCYNMEQQYNGSGYNDSFGGYFGNMGYGPDGWQYNEKMADCE